MNGHDSHRRRSSARGTFATALALAWLSVAALVGPAGAFTEGSSRWFGQTIAAGVTVGCIYATGSGTLEDPYVMASGGDDYVCDESVDGASGSVYTDEVHVQAAVDGVYRVQLFTGSDGSPSVCPEINWAAGTGGEPTVSGSVTIGDDGTDPSCWAASGYAEAGPPMIFEDFIHLAPGDVVDFYAARTAGDAGEAVLMVAMYLYLGVTPSPTPTPTGDSGTVGSCTFDGNPLNAPWWLGCVIVQGLDDLLSGIGDALGGVVDAIGGAIGGAVEAITDAITSLVTPSSNLAEKAGEWNAALAEKVPFAYIATVQGALDELTTMSPGGTVPEIEVTIMGALVVVDPVPVLDAAVVVRTLLLALLWLGFLWTIWQYVEGLLGYGTAKGSAS